MPVKANLDDVAAQIVHQVALRENRSFSNAASTLIRQAWQRHLSARAPTTQGGAATPAASERGADVHT